jgi:hypothetical protein
MNGDREEIHAPLVLAGGSKQYDARQIACFFEQVRKFPRARERSR